MSNTPNYGWDTPDNTGLVRNGALDMRTLGDAIDTSVWNVGFGQAGKNKIINGGFDFWARGTSFASIPNALTYLADRWCAFPPAGVMSASRQDTGFTGLRYGFRYQRIAGQTNTGNQNLTQSIETANSIGLAGQTVTLSFYAKCGANYSPTSSILRSTVISGTGTDQNTINGFTGSASTQQNNTLTTSYQRFSMTYAVPANATQLAISFTSQGVGTAGANDWFEVAGVMLEAGNRATPFQTASGGSIQGELAMCQRYYYRNTPAATTKSLAFGQSFLSTNAFAFVTFPVTMRIAPTSLEQSGTASDYSITDPNSVARACTAVPTLEGRTTNAIGAIYVTATNMVAGNATVFQTNSANGFIGWSAEL